MKAKFKTLCKFWTRWLHDSSECTFKGTCNNYLLSLLREVKGGKISDIQNNTNESKRVLVTDINVPSLQGMVLTVTSMSLDEFVLEKNNLPVKFPQKAK